MNRTRNQLWPLLLILIVCAVLPKLYQAKQSELAPDGDWIDLMQVWQPEESSSAYRFWLPSPQPLVVTLIKHAGGPRNQNRIWKITLSQSVELVGLRSPLKRSNFGNEPPFQADSTVLTDHELVGSNKDFFSDARPGMWYRRHRNSWQFLTYQDINAPGPGPIEVVPRAKIKLGQECEYGEGYFTWQPGGKWLACDRHGNVGPLISNVLP